MHLIKTGLDKILEITVAVILGLLTLVVVWQVIARYVVKISTPCTEELAMFLMIWLSLLGACVAYRRGIHLGIDALVICFSHRAQNVLSILAHILIIIFAVTVMIAGGLTLVKNAFLTHQYAPATGIRMGYIYLAVPISGLFILLDGLDFIYQIYQSWQKSEGATSC